MRAGVALARWLFLVFLASYLTLLLLGHLSDSPLLDGIDPTFLLLTALGLGIVVVFLAEET